MKTLLLLAALMGPTWFDVDDEVPAPLPDPVVPPEPDPPAPNPPQPSGCQCGCGRQNCRCGRTSGAVAAVACSPMQVAQLTLSTVQQRGIRFALSEAVTDTAVIVDAYGPKWCTTCPAHKAILKQGDAELTIRWIEADAPQAVKFYPCFFVGTKFIAEAPITLAELKRRVMAAGIVSTSQPTVTGTVSSKAEIDAQFAQFLDTPLAKGSTVLAGPAKVTTLGDLTVNLKPTSATWDFTGVRKFVNFATPFPKVRVLRLVDIDCEGFDYDGKRLTVKLRGVPDMSITVK